MSAQLYSFTTILERHQKNCRLMLEIGRDSIPLSFDDAIEFKIEIAQILVTDAASPREVSGTLDQWRIRFSPNGGGFAMEFRHPIYSVGSLSLGTKQAERFTEQVQHFIDAAGSRS
jgi:hypothetical protein